MKNGNLSRNEIIFQLEKWFDENCYFEWEHDFGIKIETSSNPGWIVKIDLSETRKMDVEFVQIKLNSDSSDEWIVVTVFENVLTGGCAPFKLEKTLEIMLDWLKSP